jgi:4-hydroxybenzoate polyprenyltransferase
MTPPTTPSDLNIPLCVDLDGTLVKTDTFVESLILLFKTRPWYLFLLPFWALQGKAQAKRRVAELVSLEVHDLPYNEELCRWLAAERRRGRPLVLATGADGDIARRVARHLGLFSEVLASDGAVNLSGASKAKALVARYGTGAFDYAGNGRIDLQVWRQARRAILVGPSPRLRRRAEQLFPRVEVVGQAPPLVPSLLRTLRVHQWLKNLLLVVPLVAANRITDPVLLGKSLVAFCAFSLCASGIYIYNDLMDLEADRQHHQKRRRPLAAGEFPLAYAPPLALLLLAASFGIAGFLPRSFLFCLALYVALNFLYSFYLKRIVLLDVCLLALLYTIRIFAGGEATHILISYWLLTFSLFFFLSLAFLKRFSELKNISGNDDARVKGRGYFPHDLEAVVSMGTAAGYLSVLVFALYINSPTVAMFYLRPHLLWLIIPLLLYWISHMWLLAHRGLVAEDPIIFAIKDGVSYVVMLLFGVIFLLSR